MKPSLFISQRVATEFQERIEGILAAAPHKLELLRFTPDASYTAEQIGSIEVAFYSRDIWEGTVANRLTPAAQAFWPLADAAPGLQWLQVVAAGVDNPSYQPSIQRGVRITTSSGTNAEPVGLSAVTGLMMLSRGFPHWIQAQQKREWSPIKPSHLPKDLRGQTAVIVGVGQIGTVIARSLQALGVRTIGLRRQARAAEHFDQVLTLESLDGLLPRCDWLVLACPITPQTRSLIDARRLALLPRSAGLVNIARGEIVHEAALIEALSQGRLLGAYLDVFEREPLPPESPLWSLPNVLVTPHNAAASSGNYQRGMELFLRNLKSYLHGEPMENEIARA